MRILDRYLLREFLAPFATFLAAFCLLFVVFDLFDRLGRFLEASAPVASIPVYYGHFLLAFNGGVSILATILPASLLLASLYCASNMIRHNEFVAMMAGGVSFGRILAPFLAMGFVSSLVALAIQEGPAPRSNRWMRVYERDVLKKGVEKSAPRAFHYMNAAEQRLWEIDRFDPTNAASPGKVTVTQTHADGSMTEYFTGSARWAEGSWWLRSPRVTRLNADGARVGEPQLFPKQSVEMRDWAETPQDFEIGRRIEQDRGWQELPTRDIRAYLENHPWFPRRIRAEIATDYHARHATPFICLVVALLGVPTGLKTARTNAMARILLSLGLFFLYYVALQASLLLGKTQWLPPVLAAWLPNLLFAALGVRLIRKMT